MRTTTCYDTFYRSNKEDLRKVLLWKTQIRDQELVSDLVEDFMLYMIEKSVLEKYDATKVNSNFVAYIISTLINFVSNKAKKNNRLKKGAGLRKVQFDEAMDSKLYNPYDDLDIGQDWRSFCLKIINDQRVRPVKKAILKQLNKGFRSVEIASNLGVSAQAVSLHVIEIKDMWMRFYK